MCTKGFLGATDFVKANRPKKITFKQHVEPYTVISYIMYYSVIENRYTKPTSHVTYDAY